MTGQINKRVRILATGSALPKQVMHNSDLEKILDTSDAWIKKRTGIESRHVASEETTLSLALEASRNLLANVDIGVEEIDLIVFATTSPDQHFPAMATGLQRELNSCCPAFDIQAVCAGFVFALNVAWQYLQIGQAKNILIVGSETITRLVDWTDRSTAVLFGDGAGAILLSANDSEGSVLSCNIHSNGRHQHLLETNDKFANTQGFITMKGPELFRVVTECLGSSSEQALKEAGITTNELDWVIPHQANMRIIEALLKRLNLSNEKVIYTIGQHGNTSAASIPIALDKGIRTGAIKRGHNLLFTAIGGGLSWGSAILRY